MTKLESYMVDGNSSPLNSMPTSTYPDDRGVAFALEG
jgi:hypothetical protein